MTTFTPRYRPSRRSLLKGTGAALIGLTFLPRFSLADEEKRLNFYNWDTYIGETTLADFNAATGIEVKMDLYADNDELFAKLKEGNPGYDVIVPTNDFVERMIKAGMLEPLDHAKIPNMANIAKAFQDAQFDPGRKHSVPYMWGTLGVGYRKSKTGDTDMADWKPLLESDQFAGRISLLGDAQNVIGCTLKYLGHSFNSTDPAQIKHAEELLIAQKKNIKTFAKDNGQDMLASGEVDACMEWNGDIKQVIIEDADLAYAVPKQGSLLWQDCVCIPKGAPHPNNAHAFINFLLDAEAGKRIIETIQYASANQAAKDLMPAEYRDNPTIFPPEDVIAKCEPGIYVGEDAIRVRDEAWTRIQAA